MKCIAIFLDSLRNKGYYFRYIRLPSCLQISTINTTLLNKRTRFSPAPSPFIPRFTQLLRPLFPALLCFWGLDYPFIQWFTRSMPKSKPFPATEICRKCYRELDIEHFLYHVPARGRPRKWQLVCDAPECGGKMKTHKPTQWDAILATDDNNDNNDQTINEAARRLGGHRIFLVSTL